MNKARKCVKQDNSQNLSLGCFLSKMASVEDKNFPYRTYSQIHRKDKYSEHSSIIWPVWPNGCGFTLKCVSDMTRTYSQTGKNYEKKLFIQIFLDKIFGTKYIENMEIKCNWT